MHVKQKLKFIIASLPILLIVFSGLIYFSLRGHADALQQSHIADEMVMVSLTAQVNANDHLLHPGERTKTQWKSGQDRIRGLTELDVHLDTKAEQEFIGRIRNNVVSANVTFGEIALLSGDTANASLRAERENQLVEELMLKMQETTFLASQLADFNDKEAADFLKDIFTLFSALTLLFLAALLGSFWVIWHGVSQLDLAKTQAEKEEGRLNILLESIGDGVFAIDRSWNITLWNRAATLLTGWSAEEALGKPFRSVVQFVNKENNKENIVFIEEAMLYGKAKTMENHTVLVRKDGREIPIGDSASPIVTGGQVSGCIIVFRDVSQELLAENIKEELAFRVVHDLRSPLTVMRSVLAGGNMAKKCGDDPELKEGYTLLGDATKQMLGMVNDLLGNIKAAKTGSSLKKIALTEIVKEVARTLKPVAGEKSVDCAYAPPAGLPLIAVPEPEHIKEIFTNLFTNAIKYNKKGGTIVVTHEVIGKLLKTSIADTGVGISEENIKNLFAPYMRVNEREGIQGTGLGLYIVKKLAEEANGKVEVSSKEEVGTTFSVYLPITT